MINKYECPVCGYDKLKNPIYDEQGNGTYEICVCCGFEFGNDDFPNKEEAYVSWRNRWKENGCKWFSTYTKPDKNWNPKIQISKFESKDINNNLEKN